MPSPPPPALSQIAQLKAMAPKKFSDMGDLIGIKEGQFLNIKALEQHLTTLSPTTEEERQFLAQFASDLDKFKVRMIAIMEQMEADQNLRGKVEGGFTDTSELTDAQLKIANGFDQIRNDVNFVVGNLNDTLKNDEKTKQARKALAASCFQLVVGIAGLSAVTGVITSSIDADLIEKIKAAGTVLSGYLSADVAGALATTANQRREEKAQGSVSSIDSSAHSASINFLQLLKNQTMKDLDQAKVEVRQSTLPDWDNKIKEVNREVLLNGDPNSVRSLYKDAMDGMADLVRVERKNVLQSKLDELPPGIKKIMASSLITEASAYDQEMRPIREYFHMRFIANHIATRDYNNPANQAYGYVEAQTPPPNSPTSSEHQLMTRVDKFRYFPPEFTANKKLLSLSKPYIRTSKVSVETIHKGGEKIRTDLVTNIRSIKENQATYGFKGDDSGAVNKKAKGTVEDMLRSYAIIGELMQNPPLSTTPTSTLPFFKSEDELVEIIKSIMKYNVFFETHKHNTGDPLVTPLSVFNLDPHLKNLISSNPDLQASLYQSMTENDSNFILRCLTDPNINKMDVVTDKRKLDSTLNELIKVYELSGANPTEVAAVRVKATNYINAQCDVKGPLLIKCSDTALWLSENLTIQKATFQKLAQVETMSSTELEAAIEVLERQRPIIQPVLETTKNPEAFNVLIQSSKELLVKKQLLAQLDPYSARIAPPASPSSTAVATPSSSPASPSSTAISPSSSRSAGPPSQPSGVAASSTTLIANMLSAAPNSPSDTASSPTSRPAPAPPDSKATTPTAAQPNALSPSSRQAPPPPPSSPSAQTGPRTPSGRTAPPPPASPASPSPSGENVTTTFRNRMPREPGGGTPPTQTP